LSRALVAMLATAVVLTVGIGAPAAHAAPSGTSSISGRVVDSNGDPIAGICAHVENGADVQSDGTGVFTIGSLDPGSYKVGFTDCNPSPAYVDQWYSGRPDANSADPVVVLDGVDSPIGDVTLVKGVSVAGTVTDTNGVPLSGITVTVTPTAPSPVNVSVQTGADGTYTTPPVAAGSYAVGFVDQSPNPAWATQYWKQAFSRAHADALVLDPANGPTQPNIDAKLTAAATIAGTVHGPGGIALPGICVDANVVNGSSFDWIAGTVTDGSGEYTLGQLPATDVRVHFRDCSSGPYLDQWYDAQDSNTSTPVVLAAGDDRTGIDADLVAGVVISGHVRDIDGNPIAGIAVNVNPTGNGASTSAQTDAAGAYQTGGVAPGPYRVQFRDTRTPAVWASQFWNGHPSQSTAKVLNVPGTGPVVSGVNARLVQGATVTGTVTAGAVPVQDICVSVEIPTASGSDWVDGATTGADGTYTIGGLPSTSAVVRFQDCNDVGPYVQQFWSGVPGLGTATPLSLVAGVTSSGIDAQLALAGRISGTVTNASGAPLRGICVQATTKTFVGGLSHTDTSGKYAIDISRAGQYRVQFVDCRATPKYAGQWWNQKVAAKDAQTVAVVAGQKVKHIDATLARGTTGSISGRVVNLHGVAMHGACVVAFLPSQYALFGLVSATGTYTVPNVPSGSYALAFLDCPPNHDPDVVVQNPESAASTYVAAWWKGTYVQSHPGEDGLDPIAQGAQLVTVAPGQHATGYSWCFGCTAVAITKVSRGPGALKVTFATPGLGPSTGVSSLASGHARTYRVTCTSATGGVARTVTGTASPISVTGLTKGKTYGCVATALDGTLVVGTSVRSTAVSAS
jgi:hypothetical protein